MRIVQAGAPTGVSEAVNTAQQYQSAEIKLQQWCNIGNLECHVCITCSYHLVYEFAIDQGHPIVTDLSGLTDSDSLNRFDGASLVIEELS